jgi:hypothetical protein
MPIKIILKSVIGKHLHQFADPRIDSIARSEKSELEIA